MIGGSFSFTFGLEGRTPMHRFRKGALRGVKPCHPFLCGIVFDDMVFAVFPLG